VGMAAASGAAEGAGGLGRHLGLFTDHVKVDAVYGISEEPMSSPKSGRSSLLRQGDARRGFFFPVRLSRNLRDDVVVVLFDDSVDALAVPIDSVRKVVRAQS
jgi:hypothetical protein